METKTRFLNGGWDAIPEAAPEPVLARRSNGGRIEVVTNEAQYGFPSFTVTVGGRSVATFGSQRAAIAHSAILTMRQQARARAEAT